jgi:hypothetical protein
MPPAIQATFIAKPLSILDDRETSMKLPSAVAASLACLIVAPISAQTTPSAALTTVPVPATKRVTCLATTQSLQGQDKRDQMQLCMAQARLDCLKQAIDQKIVGKARKSAIKTCVGTDGPEQR